MHFPRDSFSQDRQESYGGLCIKVQQNELGFIGTNENFRIVGLKLEKSRLDKDLVVGY